MSMIPFAEWRPDMPSLSQWAREAQNVVPAEESYRPLNGLAGASSPLFARCQGAAWFRGTAGATRMFAGDAARLYLLSGTAWSDVTSLATAKTITAITKANPGKVTAAAHGYGNGDQVFLSGVAGMTQVNGLVFTVTVVDANNFTIGIDTTGYSTYTSGGTAQKELLYSPGGDGTWRFTQFGPLAIAVNGVDAPQAFDLSVGTRWSALAGAPPVGTFVTTVRDFVLMGKIGATPQRVQWSGINNANLWGSVPSNQADFQDLPDGGNVTGLVGGEYALIFQETSVRRMTYEGPPIIFRIDKIANDIGASVPGSVASLIDMAFFCHKSGFYMVQGGQTITPIGRGKVDRTFWAEFDETNHFRASAAIDPVRGLYVFAYPATRQRRHAQPPADLQLAHRQVGACQGDLRAGVRRRQPAELHARAARRLQRRQHARKSALLARFVVLDRPGLAAAVRLRHGAQERLVLRPDAAGDGGDGGIRARRRNAIRRARLPAADRWRQSADRDRRARDATGHRGLRASGRADAGRPGAGLPERPLLPRQGDDAGGRSVVEHAGHRRSRRKTGRCPMSLPALPVTADTRSITERVNVLIRDYNTLLRVPAGCVMPFAGATPPDGWLLCYGQAVSRTTYPDLFAAIATTYGAGDGSTTFNLPDLRGRVAAGKDDMGGIAANRMTSAAGRHQRRDARRRRRCAGQHARYDAHARAQPRLSDPGHAHNLLQGDTTPASFTSRAGEGDGNNNYFTPTTASGIGITIANAGGGGAHNNTQPTIILNHIIST